MTATDTTSTSTEWVPRFERSLQAGDPLGASDALRKSGVNGWVRKDHYDAAVKVIDRIGPAPRVRLDWAERPLASSSLRSISARLRAGSALSALEDVDDLWADLQQALDGMAQSGGASCWRVIARPLRPRSSTFKYEISENFVALGSSIGSAV